MVTMSYTIGCADPGAMVKEWRARHEARKAARRRPRSRAGADAA